MSSACHPLRDATRTFNSCMMAVAFIALLSLNSEWLSAAEWSYSTSFSPEISKTSFSGRVYLFFSKGDREPRFGPNWFHPEPFAAKDVSDLKPGQKLTLSSSDPDLLFFPENSAAFDPTGYRVQAVMRFDDWSRKVGTGEGNGFSKPLAIEKDSQKTAADVLIVDRIVPEQQFKETDVIKLCEVHSPSLSKFHGREVKVRAAVILPKEYAAEPDRKYPTLFIIPGFGGTHFVGSDAWKSRKELQDKLPVIRVVLNPACPYGHHVFADSDVNGPWGSALIEEFLPEYEKRYRAISHREARYLTGHSSGGWSSLWLMVSYPSVFGATWSTAPDPVTFRDFQQVNMYRINENLYYDQCNTVRPLARKAGEVVLWYPDFDHMETVLGRGGQLRSFEAVFGRRQTDGSPVPVWNRETGAIDREAVQSWEKYDIVKKLEAKWTMLNPLLSGRLHVHMGEKDTFYLDGACEILKETMSKFGEPEAVTMHSDRTHFDLLQPELKQQIADEIIAHYQKYFEADGSLKTD